MRKRRQEDNRQYYSINDIVKRYLNDNSEFGCNHSQKSEYQHIINHLNKDYLDSASIDTSYSSEDVYNSSDYYGSNCSSDYYSDSSSDYSSDDYGSNSSSFD